jgi:hypothetical protein
LTTLGHNGPVRAQWGRRVVAAAAALACVGLPPAAGSSATGAEPLRLLISGDSVTHGVAGDWTWRYRLWKHLDATSTLPVDFVGPRDDLFDPITVTDGNHDYLDPAFDTDHAAVTGISLAYPAASVTDLVEAHEPDVIVEMLGVIDLIYFHRTPESVAGDPTNPERQPGSLTQLVRDARSVNPGISVVLAEVPQWWLSGASEVNALLHLVAAALDEPGSRVAVAETADDYTSSGSTHDGSHPDAHGELQLAAAVGDALAGLGVGSQPPRPLPVVPLGPRLPVQLSGTVSDGEVSLSWRRSPGADTSQVQSRDSVGGAWTVAADTLRGTTWSTAAPPPGRSFEFRVLPRKGWQLALPDVASNVVTVTMPPLPGRTRPRVDARTRRAVVTWSRVHGAASYTVGLKKLGRPGWQVVVRDRVHRRLVLSGLRPGGTYVVRVRARNVSGTGPWSRARFILQ